MAQNGWGNEFGKLVDYYFQRLISVTQDVTQQKMQYIVWQEGILKLPFFKYWITNKLCFIINPVADFNATLPSEVVINVWKGENLGIDYLDELKRVKTIFFISQFLNHNIISTFDTLSIDFQTGS